MIGPQASKFLLGAFASLGSMSSHAQAATAATGCPQFHCTSEATGVMYQPIVGSPGLAATITRSDASFGTLHAQGCSGDGTLLACLVDSTTGTLKIVDTTARPTLKVIHSDGSLPPSKRLVKSWFNGQVPFMFSDGRVGAGDARAYKIYDFSSTVPKVTSAALPWPARENATTMGLTDLANGYGVVSRTDGVLTFIDMALGTVVGDLSLTGENGEPVILPSPPSASDGVLHAIAKGDTGYLYAVSMNGNAAPTTWNWRYAYAGKSGASPVAATPSTTGYAKTLILLSVTESNLGTPQLQGIIDNGSSANLQWYIPLSDDLSVSPAVDELNGQLYFIYRNGTKVWGYPLHVSDPAPAANTVGTSYDLRTLTGMSGLYLKSHLGAVQAGLASDFTLLVSGRASPDPSSPQYMVALRPNPAPGAAWSTLISPVGVRVTGAWNLSPSTTPGVYCPLVVNSGTAGDPASNGLALMCDH